MKKTIKKIVLNTNEEVEVDANTGERPEHFLRISSVLLIGAISNYVNHKNIGIAYLYQKQIDDTYSYVATIDTRPLETNINLKSVKNLMQLNLHRSIASNDQGLQFDLELEKCSTLVLSIPPNFRYVFGGKVVKQRRKKK